MALWSDPVVLISPASPSGETNERGFDIPAPEQSRLIFGNAKSVGYSEFYKSQQAGYKTELKIDVWTQDYQGEPLAEYGGRRFRILRTYKSKAGDKTELTLCDLSEETGPPATAPPTEPQEGPQGLADKL